MSNLSKGIFTMLLVTAAFSASAETEVITQRHFNDALESAKTAYVSGDYAIAAEAFEKTAKWGDKYSQYLLGTMYSSGKGVEKNSATAYAWLAAAAESRNKDYRRAANQLSKSLSDSEKQAGEKLAAKLLSHYGMEATGVRCKRDGRVGSNIKNVVCQHKNLASNSDYIVPVYPSDSLATTTKSSFSDKSGT